MANVFELMSIISNGIKRVCGPECFDVIDQERLYSSVNLMLEEGQRDDLIIEILTSELIVFVRSQREKVENFSEVNEADILKSVNFGAENSVPFLEIASGNALHQNEDPNFELLHDLQGQKGGIPATEPITLQYSVTDVASPTTLEQMQRSGAIPKQFPKTNPTFSDDAPSSLLSTSDVSISEEMKSPSKKHKGDEFEATKEMSSSYVDKMKAYDNLLEMEASASTLDEKSRSDLLSPSTDRQYPSTTFIEDSPSSAPSGPSLSKLGDGVACEAHTSDEQDCSSTCGEDFPPSGILPSSPVLSEKDEVVSNTSVANITSKNNEEMDVDSGLGTACNSEEVVNDGENSMLSSSALVSELLSDADIPNPRKQTPEENDAHASEISSQECSMLSNSDGGHVINARNFSDDDSNKDVDEISLTSTAEMDAVENLHDELDGDYDFHAILPNEDELSKAEALFEHSKVSGKAVEAKSSEKFIKQSINSSGSDADSMEMIEVNLSRQKFTPPGNEELHTRKSNSQDSGRSVKSPVSNEDSSSVSTSKAKNAKGALEGVALHCEGATALTPNAMDASGSITLTATLSSNDKDKSGFLRSCRNSASARNTASLNVSSQEQWKTATGNISGRKTSMTALDSDEWLAAHCVLLFELFPDAETGYLTDRCQEIIGDEERFSALIEELSMDDNIPLTTEAWNRQSSVGADTRLSETLLSIASASTPVTHASSSGTHASSSGTHASSSGTHASSSGTHASSSATAISAHASLPSPSTVEDASQPQMQSCQNLPLHSANQHNQSRNNDNIVGHDNMSSTEEFDALLAHQIDFEGTPHDTSQDVVIARLMEMDEAEAARAAEEVANTLECCCCTDKKPLMEMLPCGEETAAPHFTCNECLKKYVEEFIGQNKLEFPCLDTSGCQSKFPDYAVKNVLGPAMFRRLQERRQAEEVEAAQVTDLERCPFCNYAVIIEEKVNVRSTSNLVFRCESEECGKRSCRLCQKEDHSPNKCEEADDQKNARTTLENAMSEAMVREIVRRELARAAPSNSSKTPNKTKEGIKAVQVYASPPVRDMLKRAVSKAIAAAASQCFGKAGQAVASIVTPLVPLAVDSTIDLVTHITGNRNKNRNSGGDAEEDEQ